VVELPVLVVLPGATRTIELRGAKPGGPSDFRMTAEGSDGPLDIVLRNAP
jgi:hypothetical protein